MRLNVGLIGAGYWGTQLIRTVRDSEEATLRSVTDRDQAQLARVDAAIMRAASVEELCGNPDVDAVLIATPPATHYALARQVLRAGKHCWVEKPLALRPDDAHELVALAQAQQRTLFVDETFLYDPLVQQARDWIHSGRLGRVFHYSFERLSMGRIRRDSDIWWNAAPHDLALLRYLASTAVASIRVERFAYTQPQVADMCIGSAVLEDGASVHLYMSWLSPVKVGRTMVVGDRGMLVYDGRFGARALTFYEYCTPAPASVTGNVIPIERFAATETVHGGSEEPLALAFGAFVDSIRTGEPAASDGGLSRITVELLAAAEQH